MPSQRGSPARPRPLPPSRQNSIALQIWSTHISDTYANEYFGAFSVVFVILCSALTTHPLISPHIPGFERKTLCVAILLCTVMCAIYRMRRSELERVTGGFPAAQVEMRAAEKALRTMLRMLKATFDVAVEVCK